MVRAATWLHFGSGGAARARVSTIVTSMPRQARSIASVNPTGPAPTISTSNSVISGRASQRESRECLPGAWLASFRLGAGIFDDRGPSIHLGLHVFSKTVRCRWRQRFQRQQLELV